MLLSFQPKAQTQTATCLVGDAPVKMITDSFLSQNPKILFLNLHEDESTSVAAATAHLQIVGGKLIRLQHIGDRNIRFSFQGKNYLFDPNRIFTSAGRKDNLNKLSYFNATADSIIADFANIVLQPVHQAKLVVALHNNTNNNFSILSFKKGGKEAKNASKLYINPKMDVDDFVLTTELTVFSFLKKKNINVVLQNNRNCVDDGSLSVYCGKRGIPYINIEAQDGHLDTQIQIIRTLAPLLNRYNEADK
jgi:hypothetical protein